MADRSHTSYLTYMCLHVQRCVSIANAAELLQVVKSHLRLVYRLTRLLRAELILLLLLLLLLLQLLLLLPMLLVLLLLLLLLLHSD